MAARPSWRGYIRWSLVSVPVEAFNAAAPAGGKIHLHQLHAKCDSRIKYQKVCPVHGEVTNDEIVSGVELSPGKFVVVESNELDEVRTEADKSIQIDKFVELGAIDPLYFGGDTYFLVPDGDAGNKPYSVLLRSMEDEARVAIGQAVLFGRERLVLLRPLEGVLSLSMLKYESEIRQPKSTVPQIEAATVNKQELQLADTLIESASADKFNIQDYQDHYEHRLQEMIDAKIEGKELVQSPEEKVPPVINLMEALKRSLASATKNSGGSQRKRRKKTAPVRKGPASRHAKTG